MSKYKIIINSAFCKRCGICVDFCPKQALNQDNDEIPKLTDEDNCIGCGLCKELCPDCAIDMEGGSI